MRSRFNSNNHSQTIVRAKRFLFYPVLCFFSTFFFLLMLLENIQNNRSFVRSHNFSAKNDNWDIKTVCVQEINAHARYQMYRTMEQFSVFLSLALVSECVYRIYIFTRQRLTFD